MATTRPENHFERKVVIKFIEDYFTGPDADPDLTLIYNRGFSDTVSAIVGRYLAQSRSQAALKAAHEVQVAANADADAKLRTLSMHTLMNRGPEALAELERAWGGQTRSELVASNHARQVAAVDKLFVAVDAGLVLPVSETHLAELRVANKVMSDAVNEVIRCAAAAKADTEALAALLPTFDAGWVRFSATAKELLGDKLGQLVPDLTPFRRGGARASEAEAGGEADNDGANGE